MQLFRNHHADLKLRSFAIFAMLALSLGGGAALAQDCTQQWLPGVGNRGPVGIRVVTTWDPDGVGPIPRRLIAAGDISLIGTDPVRGIAEYDEDAEQWRTIGGGVSGGGQNNVYSVVQLNDGSLVTAGALTRAGGASIRGIARWDGVSWSALAGDAVGLIRCMVVAPNGDLFVAGDVTSIAGVAVNRVARWDGTRWWPLAGGVNETVRDLVIDGTGGLVAVGSFTEADGVYRPRVARWDGTSWSAVGAGITNGVVYAAVTLPGGELAVGGSFDRAGTAYLPRLARWTGSDWVPMASAVNGAIEHMALAPDSSLVVAGGFGLIDGVIASGIARWDGQAWQAYSTGVSGTIFSMDFTPAGSVIVAGVFSAGSDFFKSLSWWDGGDWQGFGSGIDGHVRCIHPVSEHEIYLGGAFDAVGASRSPRIAKWSGSAWESMGSGFSNGTAIASVEALLKHSNGAVIAAGRFSSAGGSPANSIATWDGSQWRAMAGGIGTSSIASVRTLAELPNGEVVAAGSFERSSGAAASNLMSWDGSQWRSLGGDFSDAVYAIAVLPGGDLVAGGVFRSIGSTSVSYIARWDGAQWHPLGPGVNELVDQMAVAPSGDLIVGGRFTSAGGQPARYIARWDGTEWHALGGALSPVNGIAVLAGGDVIALSQQLSTTPSVSGPARWDGSAWRPISATSAPYADAIAVIPGTNDILVGSITFVEPVGHPTAAYLGRFTFGEGHFLRIESQPPALVTLCAGDDIELTVQVSGEPPFQYQWFRYSQPIHPAVNPSAATATLRLENNYAPNGGYYCRVTDSCGFIESRPVNLVVQVGAPNCCPSDWDRSGGVDGDDITAFFTDWQIGNADIDRSGGTDGDDIAFFFTRWQAGC